MSSHHPSHVHRHDEHYAKPPHPGMEEDVNMGYFAKRAQAMEALLLERGICTSGEVQRMVDQTDARSPADGARVVALAWVDPAFKARLLADPKAALAELGYILPDKITFIAIVSISGFK